MTYRDYYLLRQGWQFHFGMRT
jgi:hypothetical protein